MSTPVRTREDAGHLKRTLNPDPDPSQQSPQRYAPAFADVERRVGGEAAWLLELRRAAFARFQEVGFPGPHDEAWKYTSPGPITRVPWRTASGGREVKRAPSMPVDLSAAVRIVFVNGRFSAALSSDPISRTKDVEITPLAEVLRRHPDWLQPHLARIAAVDKNAFTAWNTAFFEGGAFVRIARGAAVKEPIHVVFLSEADSEPSVSHPRVLVVAEPGAHASIVERYVGEGRYLTDAVTEISVGDDASIEHSKIQRESVAASHVHTIAARIGRAGRFESMNVALGGALARTDIDVLFAGEGGECTLNGLFVASGSQHLDNHTFIDHATPHCSSRELYKGILDGKSRGVFHGTILVRKDAQKTDAMQTNKNLLLSREALVNSTPALEIFADDVKCRHGSTIGQLDAGQLFYLRSRGIGEAEARTLLTWAFAEDVARRIRVPEIRAGVEAALGLILPGAEGMEGAAS
jgi:Fe-S cluster assembly protein SufD